MSRHRNIRGMDYDEERAEALSSSYGQDEEAICCSPGTEAAYMFPRVTRDMALYWDRRKEWMTGEKEGEEEVQDMELEPSNSRAGKSGVVAVVGHKEKEGQREVSQAMGSVGGRSSGRGRGRGRGVSSRLQKLAEKVLTPVPEPVLKPVPKPVQKETSGDLLDMDPEVRSNLIRKQCSDRKTKESPSLLLLSLAAKSRPIKATTFKPIQHQMADYYQENESFNFNTPSPDDVKSKLISGTRGPASRDNVQKKEDEDVSSLTSSIGRRLQFGPGLDNVLAEEEEVQEDKRSRKTLKVSTPISIPTPTASGGSSRRTSPNPERREKDISQMPPSKSQHSKTINPDLVLAEYAKDRAEKKPLVNLVVIGHVDAGKSTLMGHLLFRLGCVSKKMMHRYETDSKKTGKASFLYAWVLDETEEERSRGITMDIAQSRFETDHRSVTLLDAPGHKDFIPNMITGAAQADVALLVVDATKGEFEAGFDAGGQTREHTMLIRSLGVTQLGVVVNKLDNIGWAEERYKEIVLKLGAFLKQTGFKDQDVTFVPCSGLTGENLTQRSQIAALTSWYKGPCLVEVIDAFKAPERPVTKPFRMCIGDIFKGAFSGVSVAGRVEAGAAQLGQKMVIMPSGEQCIVKAINADDVPATQAFAGDHVVLVLTGCDPINITLGSIVCDASYPAPITTRFEARIVVFHNVDIPITKGYPVVIHYNSLTEQATVKKLVSQLNKSTGEVVKKRPRCLAKNSSGIVEVEVSRLICLELYKDNKDLGRFMMRVGGTTVAAGLVTKIL